MDHRLKHKKTVNLWEQNIAENLQDLGLGNKFLDLTLKVLSTKGKINILDLIKIKNFYSLGAHVKMKR